MLLTQWPPRIGLLWLVLVALLLALQYRLWLGEGGATDIAELRHSIEAQLAINAALEGRNEHLVVEVRELQQGQEGLEEKAREEMGMIRHDETFFLYIPDEQPR